MLGWWPSINSVPHWPPSNLSQGYDTSRACQVLSWLADSARKPRISQPWPSIQRRKETWKWWSAYLGITVSCCWLLFLLMVVVEQIVMWVARHSTYLDTQIAGDHCVKSPVCQVWPLDFSFTFMHQYLTSLCPCGLHRQQNTSYGTRHRYT